MFFRRAKKDQAAKIDDAPPGAVSAPHAMPVPVVDDATPELPQAAVPPDAGPAPAILDFSTTDDLEAYDGWFGQDHAVTALHAALELNAPGFNICIVAPPGLGAKAAVRALLEKHTAARPAASDWAYVHNFENTRCPIALKLPPGRGRALADGVLEALCELSVTVPAVFECDAFKARRRLIADGHRAAAGTALAGLQHKAADQNIALLRTPNGYGLAPMHDGKVVKPGVFAQLPHAMRSDIETRIAALQTELANVVNRSPQTIRAQQAALLALRAGHAQRAIDAAFEGLESGFAGLPDVTGFLTAAKSHLVRNCDLFVGGLVQREGGEPGPASIADDPRFARYLVNVIVSRSTGAPVFELSDLPPLEGAANGQTLASLDGAHMGIMPGALHISNGGALLIESIDLEAAPHVYRGLTQALASREFRPAGVASRPMPVPLQVVSVLLADEAVFQRHCAADPLFASMCAVTVHCVEQIERNADNEVAFARWIAGLVDRGKHMPLTAAAVAAIIGDSADRAKGEKALSLAEDAVTKVLAEAHVGALQADDKVIDAGHIRHVFAQRASQRGANASRSAGPA